MAMRSIEQLTEEALALPSESRLVLIEKLLESLAESDPAIEAASLDLAKRRRDEIRSGQVQAIEGEQALAQVRRLLEQ